jgi:hypothetical protein
VAGNLSDDARRLEGPGVTGARLVSGYRDHLPGNGQRITAGHGDAVEVLGHVVPSREAAVAGELIQSDRGNLVRWPELFTGRTLSTG